MSIPDRGKNIWHIEKEKSEGKQTHEHGPEWLQQVF